MFWGIILFLLAFIIRSWTAFFTQRHKGFKREKAPRIMWSSTGIFIAIISPLIISIISFILLWKNIDYMWYIKLPLGLALYWFIFWELPLILFQDPKDK